MQREICKVNITFALRSRSVFQLELPAHIDPAHHLEDPIYRDPIPPFHDRHHLPQTIPSKLAKTYAHFMP